MERILARVLEEILNRMSPEIRGGIIAAVEDLEKKAAATANPWDDILIMILKFALGLD